MMLVLLLLFQLLDDPSLGHQNQFPLYAKSLTSLPRPISTSEPVSYRITQRYTAMNYLVNGSEWRYDLDMEIWQWQADVAWTTDRAQVMVSLPITMQWGGFMDPFLNGYHQKLKLPNYARNGQPENRHRFLFADADGDHWRVRPGKWVMAAPILSVSIDTPIELIVAAKLPLFDSETLDVGAEARYSSGSPTLGGFGSLGYIHRQKADRDAFARVRGTPMAGFGFWFAPKTWTWVAEVMTHPPLFSHTGLPKLEKQTIELVMGAHIPTSAGRLTISFSEDLSYNAADFTIGVRWTPEQKN